MDPKEARSLVEAYSSVYSSDEQLDEITADLGLRATKAADQKRAQLARAGDKEGAAAKAAQAKRLYQAQAKKRLNREEVDIFDVVLEFLQVEGYAETLEEAEWMMANLIDDEAIEIILGESALGTMAVLGGMAAGRAIHGKLQDAKAKKDYEEKKRTSDYLIMKDKTKNAIARDRAASGDTRKEEFEAWFDAILEARRADKEGYERGSAANPKRKDIPHGDPSQRSMLHSKLKRRADEMGRARRSSSAYKAGSRPPVSKKEKAFLQAADRTRQSVRNPNVPNTGKH